MTQNQESSVAANDCLRKFKKFVTANSLAVSTVVAVFLGLLLGTICKWSFWGNLDQPIDPFVLRYLSLPGMIYIRLFMILIAPLLVTSLSTSFLNKDDDNQEIAKHSESTGVDSKKLLLTTFTFFVSFSTFTVTLGILLVSIIGPGRGETNVFPVVNILNTSTTTSGDTIQSIEAIQRKLLKTSNHIDSIYNIALNIFPDNLVSTLFRTQFSKSTLVWPANETEILQPNYVPTLKTEFVPGKGTNMLGLCGISLALGLILQNLGFEKTRIIRSMLHEANDIVFYMMNLLMQIMPLGLFCWMFVEAMKMRSLSLIAFQLTQFILVAMLAFSTVLFVFYPLVYFAFTRERNPYSLYGKIGSAILIAIGSCSSAITLPMTMKCMQENARLNRQVARFVLPLGMTIHMNGAGMYFPMVTVFAAQFKGVSLDISSLILLGIFSLVLSMGLPGTSGSGPIVMMAGGSIVGIDNMQDIVAYFLVFDWIMERFRTVTNIIGDCFASKCIEVWLGVPQSNDNNCNRNESNMNEMVQTIALNQLI